MYISNNIKYERPEEKKERLLFVLCVRGDVKNKKNVVYLYNIYFLWTHMLL